MDPIVFLGSVKTISSTTLSIIRLIDYFGGHQPLHVKEHLGRSLELMSKYMHEKNQNGDIEKTFSIWNVKVKKSEDDV